MATACVEDATQTVEQQIAQESLSAWQEAMGMSDDGAYCLSRSYTSAFGPTWTTQAHFVNGSPAEWITCEGSAQSDDSLECTQGADGATPERDLPTMEALYERCMSDILTQDPETHVIEIEVNAEGFLVTCWSRPINCADDCTDGVFIDSVNLGSCEWRDREAENTPPVTEYAFVLVEDLSTGATGESPGADIDAISVTIDGAETFATGITDFHLGGGDHLDPRQALGAPDSECQAANFVSLGGDGGYLMVEFGQTFKAGDSVTVYELGPTTCPHQVEWVDEDYRVSISISSNLDSFTELGIGGEGINTLTIP